MKFNEMPYERIDIEAVKAVYAKLTEKVKNAVSADEIFAAVDEHEKQLSHFVTMSTIAYVHNSINTRDEYWNGENDFYDQNGPIVDESMNAFSMALLESRFRPELEKKLGEIFFINLEMETKTFSPEIVADLQKENALVSEYQKLYSSASIEFEGQKRNLSQISAFYENPDRELRKKAYNAYGGFFAENKAEFDRIYDELVKCRHTIAQKLGYENFIPVGYLRRKRIGYDEKMIAAFREQIINDIVPIVCELKKQQAERCGISDPKLYDDVFKFPNGNPKPVGTAEELLQKGREMYHEMSAETKEFIDFMYDNDLLDVLAKDGKAPGGYSTSIPDHKATFIFSNFNGTAGDVDVLTHEAGHSYAAYRVRDLDILELHSPGLESCEVHSMTMEFNSWPWYNSFYGDDAERARYAHLAGALVFLPYGTMVDHFQHIIYEHPELTPDQRNDEWLKLEKIYRPYIDLADIPCFSAGAGWQRQLHIYHYPFYYIDYCLAQTVALEFWSMIQSEGRDKAWKCYNDFVALGGTKTFVELCQAGGVKSPFEDGALAGVGKEVKEYLAKHSF